MGTIAKHFLIAALWTATDEDSCPLDKTYSVTDFSEESVVKAEAFVHEFIETHKADVEMYLALPGINDEQFGHDLYLTSNGHGTGFWDRDNIPQDLAERLSAACRAAKSHDVLVGDDGKLYLE